MKLPNSWDKFDINEYQSKNLNEAKEYKAGDTVKLKTGETVKINQVVKGPRPQFNTYRTKVKGKQVDFGTKDIREGRLNEAPMDRGFAKDFEKDCKVLITHVKHEMKTAKGADKSVFKKMLQNLQTVAGYPALIGKMVGSN
jgi:hypothetical protein|tara:strand:- start:166 stop:588 length:423 start_codon:yes stop_codon:yes gene_type:complete